LKEGLEADERYQTLLGVTGSGKNIYSKQCHRAGTATHPGIGPQ